MGGLFLKHDELLSLIKKHCDYIEHLQKIKEVPYSVNSAFLALQIHQIILWFLFECGVISALKLI